MGLQMGVNFRMISSVLLGYEALGCLVRSGVEANIAEGPILPDDGWCSVSNKFLFSWVFGGFRLLCRVVYYFCFLFCGRQFHMFVS